MTQRLTEESTVLSASLWHADCDPFVTIVVARTGINDGTRHQTIERMIERCEAEETETVLAQDCDEGCEPDCVEHAPDIRTSGGFEFTIDELGLDAGQILDLQRNGYTYI